MGYNENLKEYKNIEFKKYPKTLKFIEGSTLYNMAASFIKNPSKQQKDLFYSKDNINLGYEKLLLYPIVCSLITANENIIKLIAYRPGYQTKVNKFRGHSIKLLFELLDINVKNNILQKYNKFSSNMIQDLPNGKTYNDIRFLNSEEIVEIEKLFYLLNWLCSELFKVQANIIKNKKE